MELFTAEVCEVQQDGVRHVLRRIPIRAAQLAASRADKQTYVEQLRQDRSWRFPGDVLEGASVPLGTGLVDIPAALRAARETGVRHYYIEDEAVDAGRQIPESLHYLESLHL